MKRPRILTILYVIYALNLLLVCIPYLAMAGEVGLAWEANTEPDLAGYKIYYGYHARGSEAVDLIEKWCQEKEPDREECVDEWLDFCKDPQDRYCHSMLYTGYTKSIDVGNVTNYTLTGLGEGVTYYLAATAYDKDGNESTFSKELVHKSVYGKPEVASGFRYKPLQIRW